MPAVREVVRQQPSRIFSLWRSEQASLGETGGLEARLTALFLGEDRRPAAIAVGLGIGVCGTLLALMVVYLGVVMTAAFVMALLLALYVLTSLDAALIVLMATVALLPFGTLPFRLAFTPTLIECALGGFLVVYLFQWMTGRRREFHLTPVSWTVFVFVLILILAFIVGLRSSRPNFTTLNAFVTLLASILLSVVVADVASRTASLRRVTLILLAAGTASALMGIVLWLLPHAAAEQLLNRLGRIGYPTGDVLRYREDGVRIGIERAIGTWIEPNAYGGFLLMVGSLGGAQLFAKRPITGWRWLAFACFGVIVLAIVLTNSRGALLGLAVGLGVIAALRYRRLLWLGLAALVIVLLLPQTQAFIQKFIAGITAADLETQMRLGEYKDALILIRRHPILGVGFSGVPEIDLYVGFSSTYLTLAAYAGVVGLAAYALVIFSAIGWSVRRWKAIRADDHLSDVWLGLLAGLAGALVGAVFDHFYFNPEYQATSMMFWSFVGLLMAATRLAGPRPYRP